MRVLSGNKPSPADTLCHALKHSSNDLGTIAVSPERRSECFLSLKPLSSWLNQAVCHYSIKEGRNRGGEGLGIEGGLRMGTAKRNTEITEW